MKKRYTAFTLAEVLITLGIIGVVAAMTIPTLMNKANNIETVTRLKKIYSTLNLAYILAEQENGTPESWGLTTDAAGATKALNTLKPYLNVLKDCSPNFMTGCFKPNTNYKRLDLAGGFDIDSYGRSLLLADGSSVLVLDISWPACNQSLGTTATLNTCGTIWVDANGFKNPNIWGKDLFQFWLTKSGIVPAGGSGDWGKSYSSNCIDASGAYTSGMGCAAWAIFNGNLDYLECPGTLKNGWAGKISCN